jgi:hypothetical protein
MNRHAGCLIVTAEDPQKADGITVAHLAEMYVHGKLSRRDIEPVMDLLEALVAGRLSRAPTPAFH